MSTILVPSTAQLVLHGTASGIPWNVVLHFGGVGPSGSFTQTQLNAMCNAMFNSPTAGLLAEWPSTTQLTSVSAIDLSTNTPQQGISTGAAKVGTGTTGYDNSSCVLASYTIPYRRRGGHPRSYLPGLTIAAANGGNTWASTALAAVSTWWGPAIQAVNNAAISNGQSQMGQVCPLYTYEYTDMPNKHKYTKKRVSLLANPGVTSVIVKNVLANQRRRNG